MREDRTMTDSPVPTEHTRIVVLVERYLAFLTVERNLSPLTIRNYAADLRPLFAYLEQHDVDPLAVSRTDFRGYLSSMIDAGIAQGSVVRRTSTARSFYRWLRLKAWCATTRSPSSAARSRRAGCRTS